MALYQESWQLNLWCNYLLICLILFNFNLEEIIWSFLHPSASYPFPGFFGGGSGLTKDGQSSLYPWPLLHNILGGRLCILPGCRVLVGWAHVHPRRKAFLIAYPPYAQSNSTCPFKKKKELLYLERLPSGWTSPPFQYINILGIWVKIYLCWWCLVCLAWLGP